MIRISQLKLPIDTPEQKVLPLLSKQVKEKLRIRPEMIRQVEIIRRSLDARRSREISFSYTVDVDLHTENAVWKAQKNPKDMERRDRVDFDTAFSELVKEKRTEWEERPVVIGFGPAGIFSALLLARSGARPIVLERGRKVEERVKDVESFWKTGVLDPSSNVQFGEGGAGTFSDGKLNTLVKDKEGIGRFVLKTFVQAGGPEDILYDQKPHIGTDRLRLVVRTLREEIESLGGTVFFGSQVTRIEPLGEGKVKITYLQENVEHTLKTGHAFLGIGHSARDTFRMLERQGMFLEPKPFAVGLRVEHPQSWVNQTQYRGFAGHPALKAASYKVASQVPGEKEMRGVYSFCMCPGGFVVASASEEGGVVTNGMSNYAREQKNANAAILVTITPEDYAGYECGELKGVLAGAAFSRVLEQKAFQMGGGEYRAPAQYVGDFLKECEVNLPEEERPFGPVEPSYSRGVRETSLRELFPDEISVSLAKGLAGINRSVKGFASAGAVLTGVESRSSSPIRMVRDETYQSSIPGIYPIGEGAGYAGGIMSAAIDGIKAVWSVLSNS